MREGMERWVVFQDSWDLPQGLPPKNDTTELAFWKYHPGCKVENRLEGGKMGVRVRRRVFAGSGTELGKGMMKRGCE